jgi:hypothetical protein
MGMDGADRAYTASIMSGASGREWFEEWERLRDAPMLINLVTVETGAPLYAAW